ncbi:hypothetical protein HJTV-2_gp93 [Haloarcula virus HJTV-2]|uniref:Uncharacterized protein n=1 Tax=Haloarcula virus HJTV-2 TaxID=2877986 RepID=A0AAE9BX94_9CAUD|nr:hypothetical protein M1M33_gp054 [Haloarcula virus HJTV-2]UBF21713.1 hypothetical protein HJTV-2_gp93 [Haloarcula virus HJTV-2]
MRTSNSERPPQSSSWTPTSQTMTGFSQANESRGPPRPPHSNRRELKT